MYTLGLEPDTRAYYTGTTVMIALPTGTKVVNWVWTLTGDMVRTSLSQLYTLVVLVLVMFTLGGTTGIVLGNGTVDIALHDTYYVVAHFHSILSLGTVVSVLVGVLYSQGCMVLALPGGSSLVQVYWYVGISLGVALTFLPLHVLGYTTQARRYGDYPGVSVGWSTLSSLGPGTTVLAMLVIPPLPIPLYPYTLGGEYPKHELLSNQ